MNNTIIQNKIINYVEKKIHIKIKNIQIPKLGMDNNVLIIIDENKREFVIKYGFNVSNDILAFKIIKKSAFKIPIPKLLINFNINGISVIVMEKINFPLLEEITQKKHYIIVPSMIANLKKIHSIKSNVPGLLNSLNKSETWQNIILSRYSGKHPWYNWNKIVNREGVNKKIIENSIKYIIEEIKRIEFPEKLYSLLHTDFNQRNLFINPTTLQIASIIDWSEAMFGDPLYDFARVRMYILHFNLGENVLSNYYKILNLNIEEKKREALYFVSQMVDYIAWYSEAKNNFNDSRLRLHQNYLKKY